MKDSQDTQEKLEVVVAPDEVESVVGQPGALQRTPRNEYVIVCRYCLNQEVFHAQRMSQVERTLRHEGWHTRGGQWYCAGCSHDPRGK